MFKAVEDLVGREGEGGGVGDCMLCVVRARKHETRAIIAYWNNNKAFSITAC